MSIKEVDQMPFSEFTKSFKAASMLDARSTLRDIEVASFPHMTESNRGKVLSSVKMAANKYLAPDIKDFKTVVGNLARKLMGNG